MCKVNKSVFAIENNAPLKFIINLNALDAANYFRRFLAACVYDF